MSSNNIAESHSRRAVIVGDRNRCAAPLLEPSEADKIPRVQLLHRISASILLLLSVVPTASAAIQIGTIVEERYRDEDLAVVIPERREIYCRTAPQQPW